jgi:hypothetical protein
MIAKAHETNVASVALVAWLHAQPAVTSIIIGARRLSQFEDNIRALDVTHTAEEMPWLNAITKPTFGFPQSMLTMAPGITDGGTRVNGCAAPISDYVMPKATSPTEARVWSRSDPRVAKSGCLDDVAPPQARTATSRMLLTSAPGPLPCTSYGRTAAPLPNTIQCSGG